METDQVKEWDLHLQLATDNVERYRKGVAQLRFVKADGEPAPGLEVQVTQKTQDFLRMVGCRYRSLLFLAIV